MALIFLLTKYCLEFDLNPFMQWMLIDCYEFFEMLLLQAPQFNMYLLNGLCICLTTSILIAAPSMIIAFFTFLNSDFGRILSVFFIILKIYGFLAKKTKHEKVNNMDDVQSKIGDET